MKYCVFFKKKLLCSLYFIFISAFSFSQIPIWTDYTSPTVIYSVKFESNFIWLASSGGVTKFDTVTKSSVYFNQFNSGLPTPNVFSVAVDFLGIKWFGTGGGPTGTSEAVYPGNGLVKYDNVNWTVYNTTNSGLPSNTVRAVYADALGNIWAGTYAGLAKFDGTTWTVYNKSNSGIPSDSITSIAEDLNGKKWIGTFRGVASFDGTTWSVYKYSNSNLPADTIRTVTIAANNEKWVGTNRGIGRFNDTTWTKYTTSNSGLPYKNVTAILPESNGNTWIGTYGNSVFYGAGLTKFDGTTWTTLNTTNSGIPKNNVPVILADGLGNKWLATERGQRHGGGQGQINRFDEASFFTYNICSSSLNSNFIYHTENDSSGNLWIGGEKCGLNKFDGTNWTNFNTENSGIPDDDILDIKFDSTGTMWMIHDWGKLTKFDGTTFTSYISPGGTGDDPHCLFIDSNGDKWVGESGTGIYIYNGSTWTNINTLNSGLPNDRVYSIVVDSSGNKWIGTYGGGVAMFDGATWTVYNTSTSGLLSNNILYITIDEFQNKWIATQNGLAKFDGTTWTVYRTINSGLPSNYVYCVSIDSSGLLWAGTNGGMAKFDGTTWTTYAIDAPANFAYRHVNFDANGNTWISTTGRGLVKYRDSIMVITDIPNFNNNDFALLNYPNPFSESTTIGVDVHSENLPFSFNAYDPLGRRVAPTYFIEKFKKKIVVSVQSDKLENGVYFYQIISGNQVKSGKMIVNK